jgi:hypothetical protein
VTLGASQRFRDDDVAEDRSTGDTSRNGTLRTLMRSQFTCRNQQDLLQNRRFPSLATGSIQTFVTGNLWTMIYEIKASTIKIIEAALTPFSGVKPCLNSIAN